MDPTQHPNIVKIRGLIDACIEAEVALFRTNGGLTLELLEDLGAGTIRVETDDIEEMQAELEQLGGNLDEMLQFVPDEVFRIIFVVLIKLTVEKFWDARKFFDWDEITGPCYRYAHLHNVGCCQCRELFLDYLHFCREYTLDRLASGQEWKNRKGFLEHLDEWIPMMTLELHGS